MEKEKGIDFSERKLNRLLAQLNKTEGELHQLLGDNFAHVLANHASTSPPLLSLAEHEQRFRALIEYGADVITITDEKSNLLFVSESYERVIGVKPKDLIGNPGWHRIHREDISAIADKLKSLMENPGSSVTARLRVKHGDGHWLWMEGTITNLLQEPSVRGIVSNFRDISERKQAEETLQEALARLQALVDNAPVAIVTLDIAGKVTTWNPAAERIFGWKADEVIGRKMPFVPEDQQVEAQEFFDRAMAGETIAYLERKRVRKDGQAVEVILSVAPLVDASGNLIGSLRILRDITEQKRSEAALRANETLLASTYANVPDPLYLLRVEPDHQFRFHSVNEAFLHATGLTYDQIIGKRVEEVLPESSHQLVVSKYQEAIANNQTVRWEEVAVFPAGKRVGAVAVTPVHDAHGVVSFLAGSVRDMTAERLAQEALAELNADLERQVDIRTSQIEAANRELEAFSYSVSHDLRAPLRAIDGFSRILMEEHGPALSEEAQRYLNIVRANAVNMGQLIDDLLRFSRAGRQPLSISTVNPAFLVRRCLEDLRHEMEGRLIDLEIGEFPLCLADQGLLQQVWMNLLANALKFTRRRDTARIQVGGMLSQGVSTYFVKDNGAGFDMKYSNKLFEVFQRLHRAEEFEGTGVGLALANRIIQRHGGRIWAESEVDNGATFYFTVEVTDEPAG